MLLVYPGPADRLSDHVREFVGSRKLPEHFTLVLDPDYRFTNLYGLRWDAPLGLVDDPEQRCPVSGVAKSLNLTGHLFLTQAPTSN